jgi:hypothetical protein
MAIGFVLALAHIEIFTHQVSVPPFPSLMLYSNVSVPTNPVFGV